MQKLKKKVQQQEQGSKENKTCRDIKRTESLREGQYLELLETEKLNHAKVAGSSKGRKKSVQCIFENNSRTGAYAGCSTKTLRHTGTREESRLSKLQDKTGQ